MISTDICIVSGHRVKQFAGKNARVLCNNWKNSRFHSCLIFTDTPYWQHEFSMSWMSFISARPRTHGGFCGLGDLLAPRLSERTNNTMGIQFPSIAWLRDQMPLTSRYSNLATGLTHWVNLTQSVNHSPVNGSRDDVSIVEFDKLWFCEEKIVETFNFYKSEHFTEKFHTSIFNIFKNNSQGNFSLVILQSPAQYSLSFF